MDDEGGDSRLAVDLPEPAVEWLDEQAAAHEVTREEFLRRLVAAVRGVEEPDPDAEFETLTDRVATLEDDVEAKVEDVRDRIVQVKREADAKASAGHDHPRLSEDVRAATERVAAAESALDDLETELEALRGTTERGFENYEEILEYLTGTTDDLEGKLTRVAAALVATRRGVDEIGDGEADRRAVAEIKTAANRHGIGAADCEGCGERVDIGLLAEPACPHCGTSVRDVEPASGFFGSATLLEGDLSIPVAERGDAVEDAAAAEEVAEALLEGDPAAEDAGDGEPRAAPDGNGVERGGDPDE